MENTYDEMKQTIRRLVLASDGEGETDLSQNVCNFVLYRTNRISNHQYLLQGIFSVAHSYIHTFCFYEWCI